MLETLAQRRLIFVTGKGGTGKSTFTAALGLALSRAGRRVLLAEVDAARSSLEACFDHKPDFVPHEVAPRLEVANIDFLNALHAYLVEVVPVERVVGLILKNRIVQYFLHATPGAREMVILSRIHTLVRSGTYDTLVVDLPASGHAVALFRTLETVRRLFTVGPLRKRGEEISETISDDRRTSMVMLSLPEEMSVNEAVETARHIRRLGFPRLEAVLLNRDPGARPPPRQRRWLDRLSQEVEGEDGSSRLALAVEAMEALDQAAQRAEVARHRLSDEVGCATLSLPVLPAGDQPRTARHLAAWLKEATA